MQTQSDLVALIGDMAVKLGLSRPAGQCFAAIWRAAQAPCADDLVAGLGLSRSNVSTALKELRGWSLIAVARAPGDRKEYFTAPADPWEIVARLMAERQRRDLAPALDRLVAVEAAEADPRAAALAEAVEALGHWLGALSRLSPAALAAHVTAPVGEAPKKKKKKKKG